MKKNQPINSQDTDKRNQFTNPSGNDDITKKNKIFTVFQNQLQAQLFNARCHDTGQKIDPQKAKMFKQQLSKINSKKHPNLLNLYAMRLGVNSIVKLASLIKNMPYDTLNLADNAISQYGIHAVKNLINTTKIVHLNLASNMISQVGLSIILDDLIKNTHIKSLDLGILEGSIRKNSLGIDGARCLAGLLMQSKSLESLKLEDNDIGIGGAKILSIALKQTRVLKHFKLSQNLIKTQGAQFILSDSMHLTSLDIGKNFIKSSIGVFLKTYLQSNLHLKKLNLEFNQLTADGVKVLCKGLTKSKLSNLNIRGNSIRDQGLQYLSEMFQSKECQCSQSLQQLDISINDLTQQGIGFLTKIISRSRIKILNISKNLFGDGGICQIAQLIGTLNEKCVLNKLDISCCKVSDKGLISLLESLQNLGSLQHIKCIDNYISDKNEKTILQILQRNNSLISLQLVGNRLSLTCLKTIKKIMERNTKQLQQRQPNKIKSQIYLLKQKQRRILQTKQRLQFQNRQISTLQQTKARLLENIGKLQKDEATKKADFEGIIHRKRQQIQKKNEVLKTKIQQLQEQKKSKYLILQKLGSELKQISDKRKELQYEIRITKEQGKLIEKQFKEKTQNLKINK